MVAEINVINLNHYNLSRTLDFLTSLISAILVKCSEQNAVTADLGRY